MNKFDLNFIPIPRDDILLNEMEKGSVMYDPKNSKIHTLNQSASLIWMLCDGKTNLNSMIQYIKNNFTDIEEGAEETIFKAISEFKDKSLLV